VLIYEVPLHGDKIGGKCHIEVKCIMSLVLQILWPHAYVLHVFWQVNLNNSRIAGQRMFRQDGSNYHITDTLCIVHRVVLVTE